MKQQIPIYSFSFDPTGKGTNPRYATVEANILTISALRRF